MPLKPPKGCIEESDPRVAAFGHPAPAWLFPYADLMTEMVCFFVILYALSAALDPDAQKAKGDIEDVIESEQVAGSVEMNKEGLKVTLEEEKGGVSYFESGFADLTPKMKEVLDKLSPVFNDLAKKDKLILVQGHTDDVPIHNDYFWSNWELSTSRATTVVEYLINKKGLPSACMAAVGYGEWQPICEKPSAACRARNRRVVFLIKAPQVKADKKCSERSAGRGPPGRSKRGGAT